jgi:hypothetical protein
MEVELSSCLIKKLFKVNTDVAISLSGAELLASSLTPTQTVSSPHSMEDLADLKLNLDAAVKRNVPVPELRSSIS